MINVLVLTVLFFSLLFYKFDQSGFSTKVTIMVVKNL